MDVDLAAAFAFVTGHARLLDRHRLKLLFHDDGADAVLAALDAYRNPDGGYGWGLEPDLRAPGSQPLHALHAFEALEACGPAGRARAVALCDWLATVTLDDGGLPFVLPIEDPAGCAPWFTTADATTSSLHGTVAVASAAHRVARHDPAVAAHPWLARATRYCLDAIAAVEQPHAYELLFALRLLDLVHADEPAAREQLARLAGLVPPSGLLPVEGGIEGEVLRPLDYAPEPGSAVRAHLDPAVVEAELDLLAARQQDDGGWEVDFASFSPAAALEWRGATTVRSLALLRDHGRLA